MRAQRGALVSTTTIAITYVWHNGIRYYVSTIDRESSSPLAPDHVYAETMAWEIDRKTGTLVRIIAQDSGPQGSIRAHLAMVERVARFGSGEVL